MRVWAGFLVGSLLRFLVYMDGRYGVALPALGRARCGFGV